MEETPGFELDLEEISRETVQTVIEPAITEKPVYEQKYRTTTKEEKPLVNCLRNEKIVVKFIPKQHGIWGNNPKHILAGGMAETATKTFVVPKLSSGLYVNVLTDDEKNYLEYVMGLEPNALSIYKRVNNFWDDSNPNGINKVKLYKRDNYFNLSDPEDYIKYKILLTNKSFIAPSVQALNDYPKATYQFVIVSEGDETKVAKKQMNTTMLCYKEFGKIEDDKDTLKTIVETLDGRPLAANVKLEFLQTKMNELIQKDSKSVLKALTDPALNTKVLIRKAIEQGIIARRGTYLYMQDDNSPLCENGEEPTLMTAAKYLNSPKHQELLFKIQAKLN